MEIRSRYVDNGRGPLHVAELGGEGPPVVCVHGLGGSHVNWTTFAPQLHRFGAVTAVDLPGFGLTPPLGRAGDIASIRSVLDAYLRSLDGPVFLVANSMGGAIAVMQAAEAPETVDRLLLVSPALAPFPGIRPDPVVAALFVLYLVPGLATLALGGRRRVQSAEEIAEWTLALCTAQVARIHPEVLDLHTGLAQRRLGFDGVDRAFVQATRSLIADLLHRPRVAKRVASISAPTMIVQGRLDRLVPIEAALSLASMRPDWRVEILEGVGHLAMMEAPVLLGRLVAGWASAGNRAA